MNICESISIFLLKRSEKIATALLKCTWPGIFAIHMLLVIFRMNRKLELKWHPWNFLFFIWGNIYQLEKALNSRLSWGPQRWWWRGLGLYRPPESPRRLPPRTPNAIGCRTLQDAQFLYFEVSTTTDNVFYSNTRGDTTFVFTFFFIGGIKSTLNLFPPKEK